MILETIPVTEFATNCYVIACPDTLEAMVVDPGGEGDRILRVIEGLGVHVERIVLTHAHVDHVGAAEQIRLATGAPIAIHADDAAALADPHQSLSAWVPDCPGPIVPDQLLRDGEEFALGMLSCRVLHTPGHTPGHITLVFDEVAFVGDVLFFMGIGRTDFPGGDYDALMRSIKTKLLPLGDGMRVYSGHGPATTIGLEREHNPFLQDG